MPNRDKHNLICKIMGIDPKVADKTNKLMDLPSQVYGSQHRKLFHGQHTDTLKSKNGTIKINRFKLEPKDLMELYVLTGFDSDAVKTWLLHLLADGVYKNTYSIYPKGKKRNKK